MVRDLSYIDNVNISANIAKKGAVQVFVNSLFQDKGSELAFNNFFVSFWCQQLFQLFRICDFNLHNPSVAVRI